MCVQYFYDFQLRALKAVLVTAGSMRRKAPDAPDELLLMRALRDMNIPKLVKPDVPLFLGLLGDLFPTVSCERVALQSLQEAVQQVWERGDQLYADLVRPLRCHRRFIPTGGS